MQEIESSRGLYKGSSGQWEYSQQEIILILVWQSLSTLFSMTKAEPASSTLLVAKQQFPWKLHDMLEMAKKNGKEDIVSWLPCERAFKVHNRELFENEIMKLYFNQTKYKSFQRQLNLWGFERITDSSSLKKGSYFHPMFIKGKPQLFPCMIRTKIKKPKVDKAKTNSDGSSHTAAQVPAETISQPYQRRMPLQTPIESAHYQLNPQNSHIQRSMNQGMMIPLSLTLPPRLPLLESSDLLIRLLQQDEVYRRMRARAAVASLVSRREDELSTLLERRRFHF